jgi:beta-glucanase (GH16 family)
MKFQNVAGSSPAVWLISNQWGPQGGDTNGQYYPEIDILEWQSNNPVFEGTLHCWHLGSDAGNNNSTDTYAFPSGTDLTAYNTYGVLWTPTSVSWYVNNVLMETFSTTSAPFSTTFGGSKSLSFILSDQAGCNNTYPCTPTQISPLDMQVQWVHVFQATPAVEPPKQLTAVVK